MYCWNSPVAFEDSEGTTPQLSINLNDIMSFVKTAYENIKNGLTAEYNKITKLFSNWSNALKIRYNEFIDKLEYALNYPDAVINQALSAVSNKLFNKDVNVRFRLIEFLRSRIEFRFNLEGLKAKTDAVNSEDSEVSASPMRSKSSSSKEDHDSILMAIFQGLIAAIELNWINNALQSFGESLETLAEKSYEALNKVCLTVITTFNSIYDYLKSAFTFDFLISGESEFLKYADYVTDGGAPFIDAYGIGKGFAGFISFFKLVLDIDSAGSGIFSKEEDIIMASISLVTNIISIFLPFGWGLTVSALGDLVPQIIILRNNGYITPV